MAPLRTAILVSNRDIPTLAHRPWATVFEALTPRLQYAAYASAAYNDSVAFVLLARDIGTANRVRSAVGEYVKENPIVEYVAIKPSPNYALHGTREQAPHAGELYVVRT